MTRWRAVIFVRSRQIGSTERNSRSRPKRSGGTCCYLSGLGIAALVDSRKTVMPSQAVGIEPRPDKSQPQRRSRKQHEKHPAAHVLPGWVLVVKGAQRNLRVAHSRSAL